ncbi:MAG: protein YgfX [Pseudomonadota bacterium]
MSIAVCAVIAPSRRLRALLLAFALAHGLVALALAAGALGRFHAAPGIAIACLLAGCALLRAALRAEKPRRFDISGRGELRLTVQQTSVPMQLAPGSTLWPQLLVLVLGSGAGAVDVLLVLPDSVARGQFRTLAVALRAMASASDEQSGN